MGSSASYGSTGGSSILSMAGATSLRIISSSNANSNYDFGSTA
jgi:hypothetical protein